MTQVFTSLLLTSAIGTLLSLVIVFLRPVTKKVFSSAWHYYIWLVVLLVMIFPLRLSLPQTKPVYQSTNKTLEFTQDKANVTDATITQTAPEQFKQKHITQPTKSHLEKVTKDFFISNVNISSFVWLTGAILMFLVSITKYLFVLIKIHSNSKLIPCPEIKTYTKRKIKVRVNSVVCSPVLIGIIKPTLLLPETDISSKQLHNILSHEMTHLKRNDILYKWFANIVKCVHWFNPAIYFITRQINVNCEISCDISVVKEMDMQDRKEYAETILSLLMHNTKKSIPLSSGMIDNKKLLIERFRMIKSSKKTSAATRIISLVISFALLISALFISGVSASELLKSKNSKSVSVISSNNSKEFDNTVYTTRKRQYNYSTNQNETITVLPKDSKMPKAYENGYTGSAEKPKKTYNPVMLDDGFQNEKNIRNTTEMEETQIESFPTPGLTQDVDIADDALQKNDNLAQEQSEISTNEEIQIKTTSTSDKPYIVMSLLNLKSNVNLNVIENNLNQSGITNSESDYANLDNNYLLRNCKSGDNINTQCDSNGNITMYFHSNEKDYVDITFTESQTGDYVAGYGVMPDTSKTFTFMGFEQDKQYNIQLQERIENDINYIVY